MFKYELLTGEEKKQLADFWDRENTRDVLMIFSRLIGNGGGNLISLDDTQLLDNGQIALQVAKLKGAFEVLQSMKLLAEQAHREVGED